MRKPRAPDSWVVHASPLITLAKAGHLALLTALATEVLIPEAVVAEVLDDPAADPARLPGVEIPAVQDLVEMHTMLAERVVEWTQRWKEEGL